MSHRGSLLCLPSGMHAWDVQHLKEINEISLSRVLDQAEDIDVLLIGLGKEISFLSPQLRENLRSRNIIVEAVATGSAISTYNILLGENRAVAAALISVESARRD
ncbi:MAG TPA: hypothetical protein ENK61_01325 [Devosia sp.]|nr:hypothetical protein [Devosia sp.]